MRKAWRWLAVLAVIALIAAACGDDDVTTTTAGVTTTAGATTTAAPQLEMTDVNVRTAFRFNAYDMGYTVAKAKGFYEEVGLNVTIDQGQGSSATIQTVASGADDFGGADAGTAVRAISNEDVPIRFLAVHLQKTPMGFIHTPGSPWAGPESLKDLILVSSAGSGELAILPAIYEQYDMTEDDVKEIRLVDFQSRIPVFLEAGDEGIIVGFATGDLLRARAVNPDVIYDAFSNYNIHSFSVGIIANTSMIENNPNTVRAFVEATTRGLQYALDNPDEAVQLSLGLIPDVSGDLLTAGINVMLDGKEYVTPASEGLVLGTTVDADWTAMLELYQGLGSLDTIKPLSEYYTNEYLPSN